MSTNDKTVKLWKIRERHKRVHEGGSGLNGLGSHVSVRDDLNGYVRTVSIPVIKYLDRIEVEAIPKRVFANAHTYHINSISLNSDQETFMSADDLRINLWHIEITNQSFSKLNYSFFVSYCFLVATFHIQTSFRYCRHKAGKHGRAHRSYYCSRVSSERM